MSRILPLLIAVACLSAAPLQAQEPSPEAAEPTDTAAVAEVAAAPAPAPAAQEPSPAASEPPVASTAPRSEPPPPPVRDFPVPDNTPPPKPDFDAPTFPSEDSPGHHSFETGFHLGVPVFLTAEADVDPGFAMAGRWGFVAGIVVPEIHVGWQANSVDGDDVLDALNLGFGVRLRMDNTSVVTPFLSAAFDMNFWHFTGSDEVVCGYYCETRENYGFSPGFSGIAGLAIGLSRRVSLDLGIRVATTFEAGIMDQSEVWVTPLFGLGFYYR